MNVMEHSARKISRLRILGFVTGRELQNQFCKQKHMLERLSSKILGFTKVTQIGNKGNFQWTEWQSMERLRKHLKNSKFSCPGNFCEFREFSEFCENSLLANITRIHISLENCPIFNPKPPLESQGPQLTRKSPKLPAHKLPMIQIRENFLFYKMQVTFVVIFSYLCE